MIRVDLDEGITLYHGDCREILPQLSFDAVITDPPWDQARGIPGSDDPRGLFAAVAPEIARAKRAVILLGCYSDPTFLASLSARMSFLQVLWLQYIPSSYRGRVVVDANVGYAFGEHIPPRSGQMVIPSQCRSAGRDRQLEGEFVRGWGKNRREEEVRDRLATLRHPMPRHLYHLKWLVRWWSEEGETVIDPFMGSGTTGVACALLRRRFIGIEIDDKFFAVARERIEQVLQQSEMFPMREPEPASDDQINEPRLLYGA
jgi:site-specific DNA-methyltransferase (adenine-specific)